MNMIPKEILIRLKLEHESSASIFKALCICYCTSNSFVRGRREQILEGATQKFIELRGKDQC